MTSITSDGYENERKSCSKDCICACKSTLKGWNMHTASDAVEISYMQGQELRVYIAAYCRMLWRTLFGYINIGLNKYEI